MTRKVQIEQLDRGRGAAKATPNPIDQVIEDNRRIQAAKLSQGTTTALDLESQKAENDLLEEQIRNRQLKQASGQGEPTSEQTMFLTYLVEEQRATRSALADAQASAQGAQANVFEQRLAMISQELERQRLGAEPPPGLTERFAEAKSIVNEARGLVDAFTPASPPPSVTLPYDPAIEKMRLMIENEREQRKMDWEERRYQIEQDMALKREQLAREEAIQAQEQKNHARFLQETLPSIVNLGKDGLGILQQLVAKGGPAVAASAASAAPYSAPVEARRPTPPAGAVAVNCEQCEAVLFTKPGQTYMICPYCGIEYGQVPEPPPVTETVYTSNGHGPVEEVSRAVAVQSSHGAHSSDDTAYPA